MIEKYLIERKDIVSKQIEKINLKIEHNSNVLEENTKKIKELEYIDDEAANIFSVKVRKEAEKKYNFTCDDIVASYDKEAI